MKIAQFSTRARTGYGVVSGNSIIEPTEGFSSRYETLQAVLADDALHALAKDVDGRPASISLDDVQLLPPLGPANKVICVGINYRKKYPVEGAAPEPDHIILFAKHHDAIVGHGQPLELPRGEAADTFDYEGEIVLVIGKGGRHIMRAQARDHIAGYTIMDDGSVRGWRHSRFHRISRNENGARR